MTHLLKLVDKMCKYEMDLASIVEDTEQTDGQTDGQTYKVKRVYTPFNFVEAVWYNKVYDKQSSYQWFEPPLWL